MPTKKSPFPGKVSSIELDNGKKATAPKKPAKSETLEQFKKRLKSMSKEEMLSAFEDLLEDETF